eukprot:9198099-Karenia_brevis.AAC.1
MIPEEDLLTDDAWGLILKEILHYVKPYLEIEENERDRNDLFSVHLTKRLHLWCDITSWLGTEEHVGKYCSQKSTIQRDIPDELRAYSLQRGAKLSEEQRKLMHQWDAGPHSGAKMQELLL